jgi:TOBE-like domain
LALVFNTFMANEVISLVQAQDNEEEQTAIVVGPIARLERLPVENNQPKKHNLLIKAQISAQQFKEMGFQEGETWVVSPRKARVFLQGH